MAGGDNTNIRTNLPDINEFLEILGNKSKEFLWPWAKEQIIKRAQEISADDKLDLLEALEGCHDFYSLEHFDEILKDLRMPPL
jgi:hypothetical protein